VRVTLVAETFSPAVNGVVNSVIRVAGALAARGHEPVVVAPSGTPFVVDGHLVDVVRVPAIAVPGYRGLRMARPGLDLRPVLRELSPDIVHLASPALLGRAAVRAANALDIPSVAVFQTDLSGFLRRYHLGVVSPLLWKWLRHLHNDADLTLVPSSTTGYQLRSHGIRALRLWPRGVDGVLFHPSRRDESLRESLTGGALGTIVVGYVGRLAAEKRVEALAPISRLPGVSVVVVGDGPRRRRLARLMPSARFLGLRRGEDLARIMASLDLVVHPGADETFCQVVQEALCSGVPVITAAAGGPLDLVRHGDNGWLWAGDDPDVLAAQVATVREDRRALAAARERARPSVVGRSWDVIADQLLAHYSRVLAARGIEQPVVALKPARLARLRRRAS
jgi:phosphatidylinositol alpha 1,6-mannosyltransferase